MKKISTFVEKPIISVILSSILVALPLSFHGCFLLSWIGFVPLFSLVLRTGEEVRLRASLGRWFFFGFMFNLCIYYWFWWLYPLDFLGLSDGTSLGIVLFAWISSSLIHGLFYLVPGILCYVSAKKIRKPVFTVLSAIIGILMALKLNEYGELAFPWVRLSLGHYRVPILIQSASIWGIEGLDFMVLCFNGLVTMAILNVYDKRKIFAWCATAVFGVNLFLGMFRLMAEPEGKEVQVTAVQGNILVDEKWDGASAVDSAFEIYSELTKKSVTEQTQLVIWPETAVPVNIAKSESWQEAFKALSKETGVPIYTGVNWKVSDELFNSAVMVDENNISNPCSKRILVPFGEKIPFRDVVLKYLPQFEEYDTVFTEYTVRDGVQIMDTGFGKIGSIICFESIFPLFSREIAQKGGDALFVITNDAWLEDSPASEQHLAHSVFRGVENGKTVVRCANVGISAFVDSRGRIENEMEILKRGTVSGKVWFSSEKTFYTQVGYLFFPMLLLGYIVAFATMIFRDQQKIKKKRTV